MFVELSLGAVRLAGGSANFTIQTRTPTRTSRSTRSWRRRTWTPATNLQLLITGAGNGLSGKGGSELAGLLEKFELHPPGPAARTTALTAQRGHRSAPARQPAAARCNTVLGTERGAQIVSLVDASGKGVPRVRLAGRQRQPGDRRAARHAAAGHDDARDGEELRRRTRTAGDQPAAGGRALPSANAALSALAVPSAPIVQNQIRPFVVAARPVVRQLKLAAHGAGERDAQLEQDVHGAATTS